MKMRELEARTGLNRETIRVYLRHGLVPVPQRPLPNVADYDESHVRAILAVRDLQVGLDDRQISIASLLKAFPHAAKDSTILQSIGIVDIKETAAGSCLSVTDA